MGNVLSIPDPHQVNFASDNIAGASPEILAALAESNAGQSTPYGADEYSHRIKEKFNAIFERTVSVFLVSTGTAANALSLAVLTPPWGSILCHGESHINNDECGAPEFYTGGAKMIPVGGRTGKIAAIELNQQVGRKLGDVHSVQPSCVSITQSTEAGSVYSADEIGHIGQICRETGLRLHMDGARFANALVAIGCSPAEMTWKAGVDALSFGATKNGVLSAEVIVLFDQSLATELEYRRKRGGHLASKMRFLSAQIEAYLDNDLWLANARHANAMANRLNTGLGLLAEVSMESSAESNVLFCRLPEAVIKGLLAQGFQFYHDRWAPGVVRLVTSFATKPSDVDNLIVAVRRLLT